MVSGGRLAALPPDDPRREPTDSGELPPIPRRVKQVVAFGLVVGSMSFLFLVFSPGGLSVPMITGRTTTFCPFSHVISDLASCAVLDQSPDRILIQHAELDGNIYYIEMRTGRGSEYFHLPDSVGELAPGGYEMKFTEGNDREVLHNGTVHTLRPLDTPPIW